MIITNEFVLLNNPKTGSTFARKAITDIHEKRLSSRNIIRKCTDKVGITKKPFLRELILPNTRMKSWPADQHGGYHQIPEEFRNREIVSIVRNPYYKILSHYEYRWWVDHPILPIDLLMDKFPTYPDITLDEFIEMQHIESQYNSKTGELNAYPHKEIRGRETVLFIKMFFKEPSRILRELTEDYINSEKMFDDIPEIKFLKQENLNQELANFLEKKGYSESETDYVRNLNKANVTNNKTSDRNKILTQHAIDIIEKKDKLIFKVLERHGITYDKPVIK